MIVEHQDIKNILQILKEYHIDPLEIENYFIFDLEIVLR
jgi:hypothetical protein